MILFNRHLGETKDDEEDEREGRWTVNTMLKDKKLKEYRQRFQRLGIGRSSFMKASKICFILTIAAYLELSMPRRYCLMS